MRLVVLVVSLASVWAVDAADCPAACSGHGTCVGGRCTCSDGWTGPACDIFANLSAKCLGGCGIHGTCTMLASGEYGCMCYPGYSGRRCDERQCPHGCSKHGHCNAEGQCACEAGRTGVDCSLFTCPGRGCSGNGYCDLVSGTCTCRTGFGGPDCATRLCPSSCNGRGRCVDGSASHGAQPWNARP